MTAVVTDRDVYITTLAIDAWAQHVAAELKNAGLVRGR